MNNSTIIKCKEQKVDAEGELQPNASSSISQSEQVPSDYQVIKNQVNFNGNDIKQLNINYNSTKCPTDEEHLDSIRKLFPISNAVFKGRLSVFGELSEYLAKTQIAVICGMAGIGKTECSKQFAWGNSAKYGMKLWLNTDSTENIQKSVHEIARKLSITVTDRDVANIINDIYDYFENRKICTLFVFDNANDKRSINHLLPIKEYHDKSLIHIIITSQNNKWGKRNKKDIPVIELNPLEVEFAVDIFRDIIEDNFDNYEFAMWEKLASCVNEIPLALQINAAYIQNEIESIEEFGSDDETFSLRNYIKKLEDEDEIHLIFDVPFPDDSENAYSRTIYIAVSMTLEKIKLQSSFDLLYAISYLRPDNIEHELLLKIMPEKDIRESLKVLSKFSLINTNNYKDKKVISVHRLVQWILRYHQQNAGHQIQITHYNKIFTTLLNNHPRFDEHYYWLCKQESIFKDTIRDYFMSDSNICKIRILIQHEAVNSLILICESLKRDNIEHLTNWMCDALSYGSLLSFQELYKYCKVNIELKYFKSMIDKILFHFLRRHLSNSYANIFRMLLEQCTDVNVTDNNGCTFIMKAAECNVAFVHYLIDTKKVDLNLRDKKGWTVFHYLIKASFEYSDNEELRPNKLGSLLVKLGFNVNVIDNNGRSLLHHACYCLSPSYVKYLIEEHKLDVNLKDKQGILTIFTCFEDPPRPVDLLIECLDVLTKNGADVNVVNDKGQTILHLAAKLGATVFKYLLGTHIHKMDINAKDKNGLTVFHYLINVSYLQSYSKELQPDKLGSLLEMLGFKVNVIDNSGRSLLHHACKRQSLSYVKYLIEERKLDVNLKDKQGILPIFTCFEDRFNLMNMHLGKKEDRLIQCIDILTKNGADVTVVNNKGQTILHLAAKLFPAVFKYLLNVHKMDVNAKDKNGWTVFHYLIGTFYKYSNNDELQPNKLGSLLVKSGFIVNVIDNCGRSLLHHACKCISPSYIEYLIEEHKLDVNLKDKQGILPIFICFVDSISKRMHPPSKTEDLLIECLDVLTKNGADVNVVNDEGQTILHLAAKFHPTVFKYLLDFHKMDVNAKYKEGVTPADEIRNRAALLEIG